MQTILVSILQVFAFLGKVDVVLHATSYDLGLAFNLVCKGNMRLFIRDGCRLLGMRQLRRWKIMLADRCRRTCSIAFELAITSASAFCR
jgi:hypothetical protein